MMNVLVIGAGGREHALANKLRQSPLIDQLHAIPGNDAMVNVAEVHTDIAESDHEAILNFVQENKIEWVVVGPEQPLIDGLPDKLRQTGVKVFGPNKDALKLKDLSYSLKIMQKYNIPTAEYKETNNKTDAAYVNHCDLPIVVKKMV